MTNPLFEAVFCNTLMLTIGQMAIDKSFADGPNRIWTGVVSTFLGLRTAPINAQIAAKFIDPLLPFENIAGEVFCAGCTTSFVAAVVSAIALPSIAVLPVTLLAGALVSARVIQVQSAARQIAAIAARCSSL